MTDLCDRGVSAGQLNAGYSCLERPGLALVKSEL